MRLDYFMDFSTDQVVIEAADGKKTLAELRVHRSRAVELFNSLTLLVSGVKPEVSFTMNNTRFIGVIHDEKLICCIARDTDIIMSLSNDDFRRLMNAIYRLALFATDDVADIGVNMKGDKIMLRVDDMHINMTINDVLGNNSPAMLITGTADTAAVGEMIICERDHSWVISNGSAEKIVSSGTVYDIAAGLAEMNLTLMMDVNGRSRRAEI